MSSLRLILAATLAIALAGCIPPTSDAVSVGEFCVGDDSCEGSVLLERDAVGRSRIDFAVTNRGSDESTVFVRALVPEGSPIEADAGTNNVGGGDAGPTDVSERLIVERSFTISPGAQAAGRLAATELGTRRNIELALACEGCRAHLEYVFEAEPLECLVQEDCSSGWFCDPSLGRCAECLSDVDCNEDQVCTENGRCSPEVVDAACSSSGGGALFPGLALIVAFFLARMRPRRLALIVAAFVLLSSGTVSAAPPGAGVSLGAGPRWVTGDLSPYVERGIGISLGQELRWDWVGIGVQLNWATFLTTQEPPPFSRNIQIFDFTAGPRGYWPIGDFDIVVSADYKRIGLAANSLVRVTGTDTAHNAFGGVAGVRWDGLGVELRLDTGLHHVPALESQIVMLELSVALTAGR